MEGYGLLGLGEEDGDLELGERGGSSEEIGVKHNGVKEDDETGEAWDEIGGSDGGDIDAGISVVPQAIPD